MMIKRLFNELFSLGMVIITTSNRHPNDLYKNGINRDLFIPFIEKIKQNCEVFNLTNETDYRRLNFKTNSFKIYNFPMNETIGMEMESIFQSYGSIESEKEIISFGRRIVIPRIRNSCCLFNFDEICGSDTYGYSDFIELTNNFNVFIITHIPQMVIRLEDHDPRIPRFIILIDILYENKIKIHLSCEVSIENLFIIHEDNFIEYEESRSRIHDSRGDVSLTDTCEDGAPM
jgi:predicted ATPase